FGLCALGGAISSVAMGRGLAEITDSEYGVGSATFDAITGAICVGAVVKGFKLWRVGRTVARDATTVYRSVSSAGTVQYVGITNNLARRAAEHLAEKGIEIEKVMDGLSRADARSVEQVLIEFHGLSRNGGT